MRYVSSLSKILKSIYQLPVHVIALNSTAHNGLVYPGVKVKTRSQLVNKLMVACSGMS